MIFPLWAVFALLCAGFSALMLLIPEKAKADGFALAYWNKVFACLFMIPFVLYTGLPEDWRFYALVASQALLWVVSDVIFFRAIPKVGAGVISRILPLSVIVTFFLWFLFDPDLLRDYLDTPVRSALIVCALCASVHFAMRLKRCAVSWEAFRMIWFVLFAAVIGPILYKIITRHTTIEQGPFAFVLFEGAVMIVLWSIYMAVKKPVEAKVLYSQNALRAGLMIGAASSLVALAKFAAVHYVDNPGLVPAVKYVDAIFIMAYYRLTGRRETADVWAGVGIVICAAVIILLKSFPVDRIIAGSGL